MARSLSGLVKELVSEGYVRSKRVEEAMLKIDRALFLPEDAKPYAYADTPLGIGSGQTISAPHMVAIMAELLDPPKGGKCLEVGAGSGYNAAIIAEMMGPEGKVVSVERHAALAAMAERSIAAAGYGERVKVVAGDGSLGYPGGAPYDRAIVTCASPALPEPIGEQLKEGGWALVPVGGRMWQTLYKFEKRKGNIVPTAHGGCVFVPLLGEHGFRE
ncbi:MAG: protein-L-isoaspartate(D-aspartate) O-methyltransferase [Euryarchaeota archaeon]|nr:protein-L-isoaspartate(D-aspartate) O-methyltransferase [Euryarchaeota archaeon]